MGTDRKSNAMKSFFRMESAEEKKLLSRKEERIMWSFMNQSGLAIASLDFTNDLSLLLIGLLSVMWLSTGIIVWMAVYHSLFRKTESVENLASAAVEHEDAA